MQGFEYAHPESVKAALALLGPHWTDAEVLAGLREGEMVVVSDRSGLKEGQKVRPSAVRLAQYKGQDQ